MSVNLTTIRNQISSGNIISASHVSGLYDVLISGSEATSDQTTFNGMKLHKDVIQTYSNTVNNSGVAIGYDTTVGGDVGFAHGRSTDAKGSYSHAQGYGSITNGESSHAQGLLTTTSGSYSHTQGQSTFAYGSAAHAQGYLTIARGQYSHVQGIEAKTVNYGQFAHGGQNIVATQHRINQNSLIICKLVSTDNRDSGSFCIESNNSSIKLLNSAYGS